MTRDVEDLTFGPRDRVALVLLAPLVLACVVAAVLARFHSGFGVDSRSHIEMIGGVATNGLPYLRNGTLEDAPEMNVAWNFLRDGKAWGVYPPVLSYVATPAFLIGGVRAVQAFCVMLLMPLLAGVFMLGRRVIGDPIGAVMAVYVVAATQIGSTIFDIGPFLLLVSFSIWAFYFGLVALERETHRPALVAGVLGGLAIGTHLTAFPAVVALLGALLFLGEDGFLPTRASVKRAAIAAAGMLLPLTPVALLNHARFGSYNPLTYGPCFWKQRCADSLQARQNIGPMLSFATPFLLWCTGALGLALILRRSRFGLACAAVGLTVPFFIPAGHVLQERATALVSTVIGYTIDVHHMTERVQTAPLDGLGTFWGPWVIKAPLQETPLLALAALAPFAAFRAKRTTVLLAAPCVAVIAMLALRANLPGEHALGFPFLYLRYVISILPFAAILAIAAVKDLPWRRVHVAGLLSVVALLLAYLLIGDGTDDSHFRRFLLLRVSLAAAVAAVACVLAARIRPEAPQKRAAMIACTVAAGLGLGIGWGVDVPAMVTSRTQNDDFMDTVARLTPKRFALFGFASDIDIPLTLRVTRDIEAADLVEAKGSASMRRIIDTWMATRRPVFLIWSSGPVPVWPDIAYEVIDPKYHLYTVKMRPH